MIVSMQSPHFDGFLSVWDKENRFKQATARVCFKIVQSILRSARNFERSQCSAAVADWLTGKPLRPPSLVTEAHFVFAFISRMSLRFSSPNASALSAFASASSAVCLTSFR
ncbi:hypothetical protein EX219_04655 [Bacillus aerophilus]|nr:hypothetical protein [Bacillus aerophilus]MBX7015864.1 hypothetical protein [Bacillus aerophilus]